MNPPKAHERCDKCGTPRNLWPVTPCVRSLTQSPRHTITRFYIPGPRDELWVRDHSRDAGPTSEGDDD